MRAGGIPLEVTKTRMYKSLLSLPDADLRSAGGLYASTGDLSTFARAVLKSSLLSPTQTREWLKPDTHTASLKYSVGKPWEIIRVNTVTTDHRVIDLYTSSGGLGLYGSLLVLVPDYDVALTVLVAGPSDTENPANELASTIIKAFLPVIEKIGKQQAATLYAGSYESLSSQSALQITVDDGPGLHVNQWVSNGQDFLQAYKGFTGQQAGDVDFRLYPTGLKNAHAVSFRGILQVLPANDTASLQTDDLFSTDCSNWFEIDGFQYGFNAADDFLFNVDESGHAISVEPRIARQTLDRKPSI